MALPNTWVLFYVHEREELYASSAAYAEVINYPGLFGIVQET